MEKINGLDYDIISTKEEREAVKLDFFFNIAPLQQCQRFESQHTPEYGGESFLLFVFFTRQIVRNYSPPAVDFYPFWGFFSLFNAKHYHFDSANLFRGPLKCGSPEGDIKMNSAERREEN